MKHYNFLNTPKLIVLILAVNISATTIFLRKKWLDKPKTSEKILLHEPVYPRESIEIIDSLIKQLKVNYYDIDRASNQNLVDGLIDYLQDSLEDFLAKKYDGFVEIRRKNITVFIQISNPPTNDEVRELLAKAADLIATTKAGDDPHMMATDEIIKYTLGSIDSFSKLLTFNNQKRIVKNKTIPKKQGKLGLGYIRDHNGWIVNRLISLSPAEVAGIKTGMTLHQFNNKRLYSMNDTDIRDFITANVDEEVQLTVSSPESPFPKKIRFKAISVNDFLQLQNKEIDVSAIISKIETINQSKYLVYHINDFNEEELDKRIENIFNQQMKAHSDIKALVIDFRSCCSVYRVDPMTRLGSLFTSASPILHLKANSDEKAIRKNISTPNYHIPLIVITKRDKLSLTLSILKETERAIIIGNESIELANIYKHLKLPHNHTVALLKSIYVSKDKNPILGYGIMPDIYLKGFSSSDSLINIFGNGNSERNSLKQFQTKINRPNPMIQRTFYTHYIKREKIDREMELAKLLIQNMPKAKDKDTPINRNDWLEYARKPVTEHLLKLANESHKYLRNHKIEWQDDVTIDEDENKFDNLNLILHLNKSQVDRGELIPIEVTIENTSSKDHSFLTLIVHQKRFEGESFEIPISTILASEKKKIDIKIPFDRSWKNGELGIGLFKRGRFVQAQKISLKVNDPLEAKLKINQIQSDSAENRILLELHNLSQNTYHKLKLKLTSQSGDQLKILNPKQLIERLKGGHSTLLKVETETISPTQGPLFLGVEVDSSSFNEILYHEIKLSSQRN